MVTPEIGFNEAVRARIKELTGEDPGLFQVRDIFPGPNYFNTSFEKRVEAIAQSMVRLKDGKLVNEPPVSGRPKTTLDNFVCTTELK